MAVYVRGFVPFNEEARKALSSSLPDSNLVVEALKLDESAGVYFDVAEFDEDGFAGGKISKFDWVGEEELASVRKYLQKAYDNSDDEFEQEYLDEDFSELKKIEAAVSLFGGFDVVAQE